MILKSCAPPARKPTFGCDRLEALPSVQPEENILKAETGGYVQYFDAERLSALAETDEVDVYVLGMPGKLVARGTPLAVLTKRLPPETLKTFLGCFTISEQRTFDQDPRFGLCVLAEVASRAMSPAVNDHGTAIDIVVRLGRVLEIYAVEKQEAEAEFKRVRVPELSVDDIFQDAFNTIARDAAGSFEVQARLQKTLVHLGGLGEEYREAAMKYARIALRYSDEKIFLEEEKAELRQIAGALEQAG